MSGGCQFPVNRPAFVQPFWRSGHLVRRPVAEWLDAVSASLEAPEAPLPNMQLATAANSFALLLVKCGRLDDAIDFCCQQRAYFLLTDPELAVQPHINLGRIAARQFDWRKAETHAFCNDDLSTGHVCLNTVAVAIADPAVLDVCRTVQIVEAGTALFNLLWTERKNPGPAFAYLGRHAADRPLLAWEVTAWLAFHARDAARLENATRQLAELGADAVRLEFFVAVNGVLAGARSRVLLGIYLMAEALASAKANTDQIVSILAAIAFLMRSMAMPPQHRIPILDLKHLREATAAVGDIELEAALEGRIVRYAMTPGEQKICRDISSAFLSAFSAPARIREPLRAPTPATVPQRDRTTGSQTPSR